MELLIIALITLVAILSSQITKIRSKNEDLTIHYDQLHEENLILKKQLREEKNKNILLQSIINKR
jgi:hypothetical protein